MRPSAPALLVLAVVLGALFAGVLLDGQTLLDARGLYLHEPWAPLADEVGVEPVEIMDDDPIKQFLPIVAWEMREWREGRVPLWCDDILGGVPLHADANASTLDPTRPLLLFLSPLRAWEAGIAIRLALAFLFMRMFLRGRGLGETASILGALFFTMGALPSYWLRHDHYLWVHALVPLAFHLAERYAETRGTRFAAYAGAAVALAMLAGAVQYAGLLLVAVGAWLVVRRRAAALPALGVYAVVALALSMARWWPLVEFMAAAGRDTAADRIFWYPPWHLPTLVAPMLFEDPAGLPWRYFLPQSTETVFGLFPQARAEYAEATLSVGAVGFLLLLVAWRRAAGTWARAYRHAGLLLLAGTMLAPLLTWFGPAFTATGVGRMNLLTTFALAVLAAKGFDDLAGMSRGEHAALRRRARGVLGKMAVGAAVLATMAFILWTGRRFLVELARRHLSGELPPLADLGHHLLGPAVLVPLAALGVGAWLVFGPARKRLAPAHHAALLVTVAAVELLVPALRVNAPWPAEAAFPEEAASRLPPPAPVRILPVGEDVLPANTAMMYGRRTALGYLSAFPEAYGRAVYGEEGGPLRCAVLPAATLDDARRLRADGLYDGEHWIPVERPLEPGVRATNFHPGWRASVDGEPREVVLHDGWAMRVEPPPEPGQIVTWVYTAPRLRLGLAVGALTGLGLLGALFVSRRRRRR